MYKLESILLIETRDILRDFEIQADHQIPAKRLDLVIGEKTKHAE